MALKITTNVLEDYVNCRYKAYLRLSGKHGVKSEYDRICAEIRLEVRQDAILSVLAHHPEGAVEQRLSLSLPVLGHGAPFILDADLEDDRFLINFDGLKRADGSSNLGDYHYIPVLFHEARQVRKPQRLLLEALGLLLSRAQGRAPSRGVIYHGPDCTATTVRLASDLDDAEKLLGEVTLLQRGQSVPKLLLNDHCQVCEFRRRCHDQAVQEDNLSLLRGMGEKEVKAYARKGLFTLTQLAHTFRPRRKGKRSDRRTTHRYHALQALAIRDKRVYVFGATEVPSGPVKIYFDIEGVTDQGYIYLVGMIVCDEGGETRHSFWADNKDQESDIFEQFLGVVSRYEKPLIFCYGSYEKAFIKRMRQLALRKKPVDTVLGALVNTLSIVYSHFYFPTYSNGLKAIAGSLGHSWSEPEASGIQSIVWRLRWERSRDDAWKRKLVEYNQEDCAALCKVTDFLVCATAAAPGASDASAPIASPGAPAPQVVRVLELDQLANNRKWGRVNFVHSNFEFVNNCAYFDYQRQRVFVRTSRALRKHIRRPGLHRNRKIRLSRRVTITVSKCPECGGTDVAKLAREDRQGLRFARLKRVLDLVFTACGGE